MDITRILSLGQLSEKERLFINNITAESYSPKNGYYVIYKERYNGDIIQSGSWFGYNLNDAIDYSHKVKSIPSAQDIRILDLELEY